MTQEEKELLLADLCTRLPYGVICDCLHDYHTKASAVDVEDLTVYYPYCDEWESIEYCKPYLRPMSSMTDEEMKEYNKTRIAKFIKAGSGYRYDGWWEYYDTATSFDYLNANHFDYRGLIPKGLAIEVTEENNPYKE